MALFLSNAIEKMVKYEYVIVAVLLFCSCGAKMHLVIDKAPKFSVHLTANCDTIAINDTLMMNIAIKNITDTIARIDSGTVVEVDSWTGVFDHREMLDCWVLYRFDEPIFLRPQESWFHKANLLITPIMESYLSNGMTYIWVRLFKRYIYLDENNKVAVDKHGVIINSKALELYVR